MNIGIDIVEISRIKKSAANPRFLSRVFSEEELEYLKETGFRAETLAGNFCAKEALMKAFGTGFRGIAFNEISVLRKESGEPYVKLYGNAEKLRKKLNAEIKVSISHCREYATATILIY